MLVRIWRTLVDPAREAEYVAFTQEYSLPMFRQQPGCLGVLFLNAPPNWGALSYWQNDAALAALATSPIYLKTVRQLDETGLLIGPSSVEVFAVHGGFVGNLILDVGTRE
jgi:quinol monooxygenase YgiN